MHLRDLQLQARRSGPQRLCVAVEARVAMRACIVATAVYGNLCEHLAGRVSLQDRNWSGCTVPPRSRSAIRCAGE
jgi:hypothetical protein